jgi:hypothetical protein
MKFSKSFWILSFILISVTFHMIYYSVVKQQELIELMEQGHESGLSNNISQTYEDYKNALHYAKLRILKAELYRWVIIPIDLLMIVIAILVYQTKWKVYRTKKNTIAFEDYPENIKSTLLDKTICKKCGKIQSMTFIKEINLQGIKMLELECQKCMTIIKLRKP